MAPTDSAAAITRASWSWRSTSSSAPPGSPSTASLGTRTPRKVSSWKRRVRSTECMGRAASPGASAGTTTWVRPSPVRPVTSRWDAVPADSTGRLTPSRTTSGALDPYLESDVSQAVVGVGFAAKHHEAMDVPASRPARSSPCVTVRIVAQRGGDHVGGYQRARRGMATELVGDQGEVDEPVAADRSAAVLLTDQQGGPSQLRPASPVLRVEPDRIVAQPPDLGHRRPIGEELGRGVAQELLVGGEVQQQRMLHTAQPRGRRPSASGSGERWRDVGARRPATTRAGPPGGWWTRPSTIGVPPDHR